MARQGQLKKVDLRIIDLRRFISQEDFETAKSILNDFGINVQDEYERTALINSVIENKIEFIKWLIDNNADLNKQDKNGWSALHFVGQDGFVEIGKLLLDENADLELRDAYGNTPLWTSIMNSQKTLEVVKLFLDRGANIDNVNNAGRTPRQMLQTIYGDSFEEIIN